MIFNREGKENILHDINLIDLKEKKMDLTESEFETKSILKQSLDEIYRKEEVFWNQRAKVKSLKEGDRNLAYFYKVATGRKRRNQIISLRDKDRVLSNAGEIAKKCMSS